MLKSISQFLLAVIFLCVSSSVAQTGFISKGSKKYLSNQVVVKLSKNQTAKRLNKSSQQESVEETLQKYGARDMVKLFNVPDKETGPAAEAIRDIYAITFNSNEDPEELAGKLEKLNEIEWAEPNFVREIFYPPNDTLYTRNQTEQWGLYKIQAAEAWNISTGDTNVVIAIVDTGIYWDHPDLRENIWQNLGEDFNGDGHTIEYDPDQGKWVFDPDDINGLDDDENGYYDDFVGWDFLGLDGTADNNPIEDSPTHGTHVAGTASAVTDNVLGVASIGFNCKLMAVKSSQHSIGDGYIVNGHNGIIYAAANGAKVINCSWGGTGFSMAEKAAVDFALEMGALVVSSSGNDGNQLKNYPASYDGVLSVGNTGTSDSKSSSSNYGTTLDVMAPGSNILSTNRAFIYTDTATIALNIYTKKSGTSMASPLVAGLAGLVFSHFDNYKPEQVLEQIRVNCDDISALNPQYEFLIGGGRINAFKALNNNNAIAVRAKNIEFIDQGDGDGRFESGEPVLVRINFVNYLNPVSSVSVNMVTENNHINITNASFNTGSMYTLGEVSNTNNEFRFVIGDAPFDENVDIRLEFTEGAYSDFQWLSVNLNTTYNSIASSNLATTITSNGSIGFNDYPDNTHGDGLTFLRGTNILWEGAFMYGTSDTKVMDAARLNNSNKSTDFTFIKPVMVVPGINATEESYSFFNDNGAGANKIGVETELRTYSFSDQPDNNYIIFRYILTNNSGANISGLYAGIFFDIDLDETNYADDKVGYDQTNNFGYQYDSDGSPIDIYVGASLISSNDYGFYAIRSDGQDAVVNLTSAFSEAAKWHTLSSGTSHSSVLTEQDMAFVVSGGPYDISSNASLDVAFVLAAGSDLDDLKASIQQSRIKYGMIPTDVDNDDNTIPIEFSLAQNYPNPFNPETIIEYSIPEVAVGRDVSVSLKIYDVLGKEVATLVNEIKSAGKYSTTFNASRLTSGVYFYRLQAGSFSESRKMILIK